MIRSIRVLTGPVGVDGRHIEPGNKIPSEGVEEAFFWQVNLCDTENVVDIRDNCYPLFRDEVACRVTGCEQATNISVFTRQLGAVDGAITI